MGTKSRNKGAQGERDVLKLFKEWWGGQPWRRSGVGFEGKDLICPEDFPFSIEVKNHKNARCKWFWTPTEQLLSWWGQAVEQAIADERKPLLVLKVESMWFAMSELVIPNSLPVFTQDGRVTCVLPLEKFFAQVKKHETSRNA